MAKIRSLVVRPHRSAELAFPVSGIVAYRNEAVASLGRKCFAFDQDGFVEKLSATEFVPRTHLTAEALTETELVPSYNDSRIVSELRPKALFMLENFPHRLTLREAILQRNVAHRHQGRAQIQQLIARSRKELVTHLAVVTQVKTSPAFTPVTTAAIDVSNAEMDIERQQAELARADFTLEDALAQVDISVLRAQHALASTFLLSPVNGRVTHLMKEVGESVAAGEPVARVEDYDEVLLVGRVHHKFLLLAGAQVKLRTRSLAYPTLLQPEPPRTFTGLEVVSVLGHSADDDEWDVIIRGKNEPLHWSDFPPNYHFDPSSTEIEVLGSPP